MFSQFVVLIVAAVLSGACAQVFSRSGCPTVQTQKTLDLQRVSTNFLFCFLRIYGPRCGIKYALCRVWYLIESIPDLLELVTRLDLNKPVQFQRAISCANVSLCRSGLPTVEILIRRSVLCRPRIWV